MTELVSTALLLTSAFWPATTSAQDKAVSTTTSTTTIGAQTIVMPTRPLVSIESYVREYFKDEPILAEIARCESTFRQYDSSGTILRGRVNSDDVGVMQINKFYHEDKAEALGYDIYAIDGNLAFGRWLYNKYGASPWSASAPCWTKSLPKTVAMK